MLYTKVQSSTRDKNIKMVVIADASLCCSSCVFCVVMPTGEERKVVESWIIRNKYLIHAVLAHNIMFGSILLSSKWHV